MCLSCGCNRAADDHGDSRNLTLSELVAAAQAAGITVAQAQDNVARCDLIPAVGPQPTPLDVFRQTFMRPAIVVDIDGTLAFCAEAMLTAVNAQFGTMYDAARLTDYWFWRSLPDRQATWLAAWLDNPWSYVNLAPDLEAIAAVVRLRDAGYDITVATNRPPECEAITEDWLTRWEVPHERLFVGPGHKETLADEHGPEAPMILFDDSPAFITTIPRPGVQLNMPLRPWTPQEARDGRIEGVCVFEKWGSVLSAMGVA